MRAPMKHIIALLVALFLLATRSDANAFVLIGPYNAAGALANGGYYNFDPAAGGVNTPWPAAPALGAAIPSILFGSFFLVLADLGSFINMIGLLF